MFGGNRVTLQVFNILGTYLLFADSSNIQYTRAIIVMCKLTEKSLFPVDVDANWIKNISAKIYPVFSYSLICFYNR